MNNIVDTIDLRKGDEGMIFSLWNNKGANACP